MLAPIRPQVVGPRPADRAAETPAQRWEGHSIGEARHVDSRRPATAARREDRAHAKAADVGEVHCWTVESARHGGRVARRPGKVTNTRPAVSLYRNETVSAEGGRQPKGRKQGCGQSCCQRQGAPVVTLAEGKLHPFRALVVFSVLLPSPADSRPTSFGNVRYLGPKTHITESPDFPPFLRQWRH